VQNPKIAFATPTRNQSVDRERLWELSSDLLGILNADGYFESTKFPNFEAIRRSRLLELLSPHMHRRTQPCRRRLHTQRARLRTLFLTKP